MQVEVENVSSMLKIRAESDNKEWRTHLELTKELQGNIETKVRVPLGLRIYICI